MLFFSLTNTLFPLRNTLSVQCTLKFRCSYDELSQEICKWHTHDPLFRFPSNDEISFVLFEKSQLAHLKKIFEPADDVRFSWLGFWDYGHARPTTNWASWLQKKIHRNPKSGSFSFSETKCWDFNIKNGTSTPKRFSGKWSTTQCTQWHTFFLFPMFPSL